MNYKRYHPKGQPIPDNSGRIPVGYVIGENFVKEVHSTIHLLRDLGGYACDIRSLEYAKAAGAKYVVITDLDKNLIRKAPIDYFWKFGKYIERGYGPQKGLELKYFSNDPAPRKRSSRKRNRYGK